MKTVKELCLGVAVAGMLAGAGSALGGAVALADAPEASGGAEAGADSPAGRGDASAVRDGGTTRSQTGAAASARRGDNGSRGTARAATRPVTPQSGGGNDSPAPVTVPAPPAAGAQIPAPASAVSVADRISTPVAAAVPAASPSAPVAIAASPTTGKSAKAAAARVLAGPATVLLTPLAAAPAAPLQPVTPLPAPLPTPVLPVAPAGAVTVTATSTTSRGRSASAIASAFAEASQIGDPDPTHVLLIGTDGTNLSKILQYAYDDPESGFRILMDQSVTGATSIVGHTTISGPSWSTILTGAWDSKTGVINNLFNPAPYTPWPTVFNQLEYFDSTIDTAVFADWKYINDIGAAGSYPVAADDNVFVPFSNSWEDTDDLVVDATIARINATSASDSTFMFSYQVAVDEAGHAFGGGSPEYAAAVVNTSDNIARIMDAVDAWETANPGEEWTIIVTTDHGHQQSVGFGHGFQSPNETSSFVIFDLEGDGANNGKQNLAYTTADITPTIVNLFGAPSRSDFDGVPLQTRAVSNVEPTNLKQSLSDAINSYGYPNIGDDIALGVRTIFASIPYFLDGFVTSITGQLQGIVDADIFLISALAGVAEFAVGVIGDVLVGSTQALARVVGTLTGAGVIAPTDPPLPPPASAALPPAAVLA